MTVFIRKFTGGNSNISLFRFKKHRPFGSRHCFTPSMKTGFRNKKPIVCQKNHSFRIKYIFLMKMFRFGRLNPANKRSVDAKPVKRLKEILYGNLQRKVIWNNPQRRKSQNTFKGAIFLKASLEVFLRILGKTCRKFAYIRIFFIPRGKNRGNAKYSSFTTHIENASSFFHIFLQGKISRVSIIRTSLFYSQKSIIFRKTRRLNSLLFSALYPYFISLFFHFCYIFAIFFLNRQNMSKDFPENCTIRQPKTTVFFE